MSANDVLKLSNQERAKVGAPAMSVNGALNRAARKHNGDMAKTGRLTHSGSDGESVGLRVFMEGYKSYKAVGENPQHQRNVHAPTPLGNTNHIMNIALLPTASMRPGGAGPAIPSQPYPKTTPPRHYPSPGGCPRVLERRAQGKHAVIVLLSAANGQLLRVGPTSKACRPWLVAQVFAGQLVVEILDLVPLFVLILRLRRIFGANGHLGHR